MNFYSAVAAGGKGGPAAARSLLRLRDKVGDSRVPAPSKLLIITATGYGYDRPDGTTVLPITALGT